MDASQKIDIYAARLGDPKLGELFLLEPKWMVVDTC